MREGDTKHEMGCQRRSVREREGGKERKIETWNLGRWNFIRDRDNKVLKRSRVASPRRLYGPTRIEAEWKAHLTTGEG
jgi:hypothetical protein